VPLEICGESGTRFIFRENIPFATSVDSFLHFALSEQPPCRRQLEEPERTKLDGVADHQSVAWPDAFPNAKRDGFFDPAEFMARV
jgi:hypothetical protein